MEAERLKEADDRGETIMGEYLSLLVDSGLRTAQRSPGEQDLAMQQAPDLIKEALCARHRVQIV